ncbi:MAG: hypothetical protein J6C51_00715 [Clostridia bacterium]|nr:hypothetical protein [Clostridia bacterium]
MEKIGKIAKNLDLIARVVYTVCSVFVWVLPITAVLLLIFGEQVIADGTYTVTLGMLTLEFAEEYMPFEAVKFRVIAGLLSVAVLLVFVCWFIRVIQSVLEPMKEGKPFESAVSDKLKKLSFITLIGGGVLSVAKLVGEVVLCKMYDLESIFLNENIISCTAEFNLDMTFLLAFGVLYLLSYIFRYGEELQKQSDETL